MELLSKGTGWYPRDLILSALNGNLYGVEGEVKVVTPTASVHRAVAQNIAANTDTVLTPTVLDWDNATFWSSSVNPSRLTFTKPGLYIMGYSVYFSGSTTGRRSAWLRINGVTQRARTLVGSPSAGDEYLNGSSFYYMHVGDYVEVFGRSNLASDPTLLNEFTVVGIVPETA